MQLLRPSLRHQFAPSAQTPPRTSSLTEPIHSSDAPLAYTGLGWLRLALGRVGAFGLVGRGVGAVLRGERCRSAWAPRPDESARGLALTPGEAACCGVWVVGCGYQGERRACTRLT